MRVLLTAFRTNGIDALKPQRPGLDSGVRVVALVDGVDSGSGMGPVLFKLLISILVSFAEFDKETIRARLLDGRKRADAGDRMFTSEPRYGHRVKAEGSRKLKVDKAEKTAVDRLLALREAKTSYTKIATMLFEEGHRPRRAATWSTSLLHQIATGTRATKKINGSSHTAHVQIWGSVSHRGSAKPYAA